MDIYNYKNIHQNKEKIEESAQDIYQYQASEQLSYIYLRNNIYVERSKAEEISFIEKYLNKAEHLFDVEMKSFIEKTLMKVIVEELDPSRAMLTNYGPASMNFMKPNNGIVFGFRYNQFDQKVIKVMTNGKTCI